jgi:general secretion pathway protein M
MSAFASLFASRSLREKLLLAALAGLILIWLAVTQVWQPLHAHRADISARIPRIERALALVQAAPVPLMAQAPDPRAIPAILTDAADTFGLKISRLQAQGNGAQLALEDAPFDVVLLWIEALQRDDALHLVDLTLTRRPAPGVVATTLTMER